MTAPSGKRAGVAVQPRPAGMQLISRTAAIFRVLESHPGGRSLGEIAKAADLPRPTVQRIIDALKVENLVVVDPKRGGVRLGPAITRMASATRSDLPPVARPHLEHLSFSLDETVAMTVLDAGRAVIVAQVASNRTIQFIAKVGAAWPLHSTADGKALLAGLPVRLVRVYLGAEEAGRPRPSGFDVDAFLTELADINRTGFAEDREATTEGVCATAVPIVDRSGARYAVSVLAPPLRHEAGRERIRAELLACVGAIEAGAGLR